LHRVATAVHAILTLVLLSQIATEVRRAPDAAPSLTTVVVGLRLQGDAEDTEGFHVVATMIDALRVDKARVTFGQKSLEASLRVQQQSELIGCIEAPCLASVAKLMDADTLFTGTIDGRGPELVVTLYELDAVTLRPLESVTESTPRDPTALRACIHAMVSRIVEKTRGRVPLYGTLEVMSVPQGLVVHVDGLEVGATPLLKPIVEGTHAVTVGDGGRGAIAFEALVRHKRSTTVDVKLREVSPPPTPEERAYQSDLVFGPYYYVAKLLVGAALVAAFGALALYTGSVASPFLFYVRDIDLRRPEVWFLLGWGSVSVVSAALVVVGLALIVWGVVDFLDAPVEPARPPMWHRVIVLAPDGEHTFMYPVDDVARPARP
jgi:hypothetical protein